MIAFRVTSTRCRRLNLPLVTAGRPGLAGPARSVLHPGVLALALVFVVPVAVLAGVGSLVAGR